MTVDLKKFDYTYNNITKKWEEQPKEYFKNKYTNKFWYDNEWIENLPFENKLTKEDTKYEVILTYF